jgi:hypothetical protein
MSMCERALDRVATTIDRSGKLVLNFASTGTFGSGFRGTRDHNFLSHDSQSSISPTKIDSHQVLFLILAGAHVEMASIQEKTFCVIQYAKTNSVASAHPHSWS